MSKQRAAVLIGVAKTGRLQTLQAVHPGVESVRKWALAQPGMKDRVVTLTDANGARVSAQQIKDSVKEIVDLGTVEQLFVYFAGHGVNLKFNEFWLLSDAPEDPQAAVNVSGSVALAEHCGIPHVVFISDACRTAAEGIQAQAVEGSSIFPNSGPRNAPGFVDVFYAADVGRPAYEVKDATAAAAAFHAVYTDALVDGLSGARPELVEADQAEPERETGRVRAWPLGDYLQAEVPARLVNAGATESQTPRARITSRPEFWLAEVALSSIAAEPETPGISRRRRGPSRSAPAVKQPSDTRAEPETLVSMSQRELRAALRPEAGNVPLGVAREAARRGRRGAERASVPPGAGPDPAGASLFRETVRRHAEAPEPGHFETQCGFKVHGSALAHGESPRADVVLLDGPGGLLRVSQIQGPAASVLLVFEDGRGALVPAIPEFIASVTYEDGELSNVTYEPSDNAPRWELLQRQLPELRSLRAVIASAARLGTFRLESKDDVPTLVERMRAANGVDPTMAVYAAYALNDLQQREAVESLQQLLSQDLGLSLFDVALLARTPEAKTTPMPADVFPTVPLLSQGWALLDAYGIELPRALRGVQRHVTDSLWTLFDEQGVAAVRAAIESGEVR